MGFRFREKPLGIIRRINEQTFPTFLISNQITEHCKITNLILLNNHLLPPPQRISHYYNLWTSDLQLFFLTNFF